MADVVVGMAEACRAANCAVLGGETAEMPGVYQPGAFDIAGTLIGVADRSTLLPRSDVAAGDVLVGLASSGPHTNGYSLLRKLLWKNNLMITSEDVGGSVSRTVRLDVGTGDVLLRAGGDERLL